MNFTIVNKTPLFHNTFIKKWKSLCIIINGRQLIFCDQDINGGSPVFLDIGDHYPVALFGGHSHSASICSEGEFKVLIIIFHIEVIY